MPMPTPVVTLQAGALRKRLLLVARHRGVATRAVLAVGELHGDT